MFFEALFLQFCTYSTPLDEGRHILITRTPRTRIFHLKTFLDSV